MASKKKIEKIEDLPGVGATTTKKLQEAGYTSLEKIATALTGDLVESTDLGEATAAKVIGAARNSLEMGYETADKVLEKSKDTLRLTTGSKELDDILGGGIHSRHITEAYGRFGSGKTQIAFQIAINVQLPKSEGGLEGNCLFIDSENTFSPERVVQIIEAKGLNVEKALKNIYIAKAYNSDHQMILAEKADKLIEEKNIKLIIVDSLTSRFRAEYLGRGTLQSRQQKLNKHMHTLHRWADLYNIPVYVTNQVMANPGLMFGDPTTPIGGHIVGHESKWRLYLRKSKNDKRIARLVDSPSRPDAECVFRVTPEGIED